MSVCLLGILEVLHCVLVESPEALNIIKEGHIKSIISLLDKHGRNDKVQTSTVFFILCILLCTGFISHMDSCVWCEKESRDQLLKLASLVIW